MSSTMFRSARASAFRTRLIARPFQQAHYQQQRFLSFTPPAQKSRSFKNGLLRWTIAAGGLYWYLTRDVDVLAEDARSRLASRPGMLETQEETEELPTVDTLAENRREARRAKAAAARPADGPRLPPANENPAVGTAPATPATTSDVGASKDSAPSQTGGDTNFAQVSPSVAAEASPAHLEQEAEQEGAFNEETGEINWDCPCLGGMAHGPCGEQFREAFSCFVFSKEEPKGIDCIDRFKTMQNCFREHPDVYGSELTDMDEDPDAEVADGVNDSAEPTPQPSLSSAAADQNSSSDARPAPSPRSTPAEPQDPEPATK